MRKPTKYLLLAALLAAEGTAAWWYREPLEVWLRTHLSFPKPLGNPVGEPAPRPDPVAYHQLAMELESQRLVLAKQYALAKSTTGRTALEHEARLTLERTLPAMMRCWLGTPWDYNGTAKVPGVGKIACGYFVATVLKDAGFRVDRYRLARQASGNILQSFLPKEACTLVVGQEYEAFAGAISQADPGIYVVGLDTHVAFLVLNESGFRFIHSSGSRPWCVVDESREDAGALQRSNWRIFGNLTADPGVLKRWLKGTRIPVKES